MLRSLKVATPATAATVVVPEREPPPGLCSIATVTLPENVSTPFPSASRATTGTAGVMVAHAVGHGALGSPGIRCGVKVTRVGAPALMVKKALVAPARPVAGADRLYALPLWAMLKSAKVATPATAATVVVPDRLPPPGLFAIATVTLALKPVAVLPKASRAITSTWGVILAPAVAVLGCTLNSSSVAGPANTRNAALVDARPVAVAVTVYQASPLSIVRFEKVATPLTAATVVVPESVAPLIPVPAAIASVTFPVKLVTGVPDASSAVTWSAGAMTAPAVCESAASAVNTSWVAVEGTMSKGALVAPVRPTAVVDSV